MIGSQIKASIAQELVKPTHLYQKESFPLPLAAGTDGSLQVHITSSWYTFRSPHQHPSPSALPRLSSFQIPTSSLDNGRPGLPSAHGYSHSTPSKVNLRCAHSHSLPLLSPGHVQPTSFSLLWTSPDASEPQGSIGP